MPQLGLSCGRVPDLLTNGERRRLKPGFTCLAAPGPRLTGHTTGAMYCTVCTNLSGAEGSPIARIYGAGSHASSIFLGTSWGWSRSGGRIEKVSSAVRPGKMGTKALLPTAPSESSGTWLPCTGTCAECSFPSGGQSKFPSSTRAGKGQCDRVLVVHVTPGEALRWPNQRPAICLTQRLEITAC
ncbi:hypothetical protein CIHG_08919 [Coccidioides immitis H538.4]|uniref:Uncharacterized protein n=1 Tax=Coccidioides immitis H538.4 TaxID=396776 RepID=A0A0J8S1D5_COCIT|nr:hypothetical protein CIHG_08919 [Coccidioides immitis H538.4]